jgi:beta-glucosidase-like glycosyl hydrolase
VKGIQDAGIIACAKHFIGNEQEHFRQAPEAIGYGYNISEAVSSNIDDTTLHETYLVSILNQHSREHLSDDWVSIPNQFV